MTEEFGDTKGVIRIRKSKDRQYNGQGEKEERTTTIYKTYKIISLKITLFLSVNTLTLSIVINTVIVTAGNFEP